MPGAKGGRPRKYHDEESRRAGINALRRLRRSSSRIENSSDTRFTSLKIHFENPARSSKNYEDRRRLMKHQSSPCAGLRHHSKPQSNPTLYRPSDVLLQDLGPVLRYYVKHFADIVCKCLVSYDRPGRNPYRSLIPLIKENSLVLQLVVASSAMHLSNRSDLLTNCFEVGQKAYDPTLDVSRHVHVDPNLRSRHRSFALNAKTSALKMLRDQLGSRTLDQGVALACIVLLISIELINSGKDEWKIHIGGARQLIAALCSPTPPRNGFDTSLRELAIADCLTYDILGTTVQACTNGNALTVTAPDITSSINAKEADSYMSCPATLLELIYAASTISDCGNDHCSRNTSALDDAHRVKLASRLLHLADSFEVETWAKALDLDCDEQQITDRIHAGFAHRSATCLYIHRATAYANLLCADEVDEHVAVVAAHVSSISPGSELLKGSSWPTFIAGAECRSPEQMEWVSNHLRSMWHELPWGYLTSARESLDLIWRERTRLQVEHGEADFNWLRYMHATGHEWIVV